MNDFTKLELEHLLFAYKESEIASAPGLTNKLETMIDNYCEHEPSDPRLVLIKYCIKCDTHLETRPWGPE